MKAQTTAARPVPPRGAEAAEPAGAGETAARQGVAHAGDAPPPDLRAHRAAVTAAGDKYGYDAAHGRQVAALALDLFAALQRVHGLPPAWGPALEHAAMLHDIGYFVSARGHHRHSRYLIRHDAALSEYPAPWRDFVALVAGNHRKAPRNAPRAWRAPARAAAVALAAILRIADGLDYGHDGLARIDAVQVRRAGVHIVVSGPHLATLEPVLRKKSRLFTRAFSLGVSFVAPGAPRAAAPRDAAGRQYGRPAAAAAPGPVAHDGEPERAAADGTASGPPRTAAANGHGNGGPGEPAGADAADGGSSVSPESAGAAQGPPAEGSPVAAATGSRRRGASRRRDGLGPSQRRP